MKIIIRNGEIIKFKDSGSVAEQLKNINALIDHVQKLAVSMSGLSDKTFCTDGALTEERDALRKKVRAQENTIALADKQLRRQK